MGLAGQKKRSKLSQDPNNTNWSKSTTNFGHKILSKQGWKPGDYLGAENAAHQDHYTAANASHIKVMLREDGLGLGAKIGGAANADSFGLALLSGVFSRLNGKSEGEVQKQQDSLRDAGLRSWQAQKYGFMNFVSGGLLVGDKIEEKPGKQVEATTVDAKMPSGQGEETAGKKRKSEVLSMEAAEEKPKKKSKKGKADNKEILESDSAKSKKSNKTTEKRSKTDKQTSVNSSSSDSSEEEDDAATAKAKRKIEKKAKREQKERRRAAFSAPPMGTDSSSLESKAERRARKEERRKRKEQKRLERAKSSASATPATSSVPTSGVSTPNTSMAFGGSRHAVRQRYIQQKRLASMDAKALNEILMIKAVKA